MALKATVHKADLQVSDLDRQHYGQYSLTLAQHPSETDQRLMVRLLTFALFANEALSFGRGLSTEDEPDLWLRALDGDIQLWIELGQPDESRLRRACGRSRRVVLVGYSGRAFAVWWQKNESALQRLRNLSVLELPAEAAEALASLLSRTMRLDCLIQDGEISLSNDAESLSLTPKWLLGSAAP